MAGMSALNPVLPVEGIENSIRKTFWSPPKPSPICQYPRFTSQVELTICDTAWPSVSTITIAAGLVRENDHFDTVFQHLIGKRLGTVSCRLPIAGGVRE